MLITQQIADYIRTHGRAALTADTREMALKCILDLLSATACGLETSGAKGTRLAAADLFREGKATVWFTKARLKAAGAALCNAAAATALDLDDGHRIARGHAGATVISTAFAVAEEEGSTADELLAAIVVGYQVAIAVAAGRGFYGRSGVWCGFGGIAAAGLLRRTPAVALAQALAISGMTAPNLLAVADGTPYPPPMGCDVKEGIPWATATALWALHSAENGVTGALDILDHPPHHDGERIIKRLGGDPTICSTYFKFYACCRHLHAPIEALLRVLAEHRLAPAEIGGIEVHIYRGAFNLTNSCEPSNLVDVQYSIPYSLGLAALLGADVLMPLTEDVLHRPEVTAFAQKVQLRLDPLIDQRFPAESLARVVVTANGQQVDSGLTHPRGEAFDPPSWSDLEEKFNRASSGILSSADQQAMLDAFGGLRSGNAAGLLALLRRN